MKDGEGVQAPPIEEETKMDICRGCGEREASAKSHIIPRSFFRHMDDGVSPLVEITTKKDSFPKRRRVGYYDITILCKECEKQFGKVDDLGQHILIKRRSEMRTIKDGMRTVAYRLNAVDGDAFKRFLVSVLWRASVSTLPQFSKVRLGPHEARAKEISWGSSFRSPDEFFFAGSRYLESDLSDLLLNPHGLRNSGVNFVCLYLPGYKFWIKVDRRPSPSKLSRINIARTGDLVLLAHEMRGSKEYDLIAGMVQATAAVRW